MGFFKSFFTGKKDTPEAERQRNLQKNFEIFKYDGMRAQRMGRMDFAIKCFNEALKLQDDFETRSYLADTYLQTGQTEEARRMLQSMAQAEPQHVPTLLKLANVCYMAEDYAGTEQAARQAISVEEGNAMAYYLLGKAAGGQGDPIMSIGHLTKAIVLKDDFTEARLLRAEALLKMKQSDEATEDIEAILAQDPENEQALLLRGKQSEATGQPDRAEADYRHVTELNPFNEQAFICLGQLFIHTNRPDEAIGVLDEAIELNPQCAQAYHERGRAKLMKGDKEGSLEDMKKELEINPQEAQNLNGQFNNLTDKPGGIPGIF